MWAQWLPLLDADNVYFQNSTFHHINTNHSQWMLRIWYHFQFADCTFYNLTYPNSVISSTWYRDESGTLAVRSCNISDVSAPKFLIVDHLYEELDILDAHFSSTNSSIVFSSILSVWDSVIVSIKASTFDGQFKMLRAHSSTSADLHLNIENVDITFSQNLGDPLPEDAEWPGDSVISINSPTTKLWMKYVTIIVNVHCDEYALRAAGLSRVILAERER